MNNSNGNITNKSARNGENDIEIKYRSPAFLMRTLAEDYPELGPGPNYLTFATRAVKEFFQKLR